MYPNHILIPDTFDEIFIMRQEFDYLDKEQKHYDGILKLPFITTARSLSYICGPPARLFAATSRQHHTTWPSSAIMLDFNRELHYVQAITADATPRIMIKASLHILPANGQWFKTESTGESPPTFRTFLFHEKDGGSWNDYFAGTNRIMLPYEACDCYR